MLNPFEILVFCPVGVATFHAVRLTTVAGDGATEHNGEDVNTGGVKNEFSEGEGYHFLTLIIKPFRCSSSATQIHLLQPISAPSSLHCASIQATCQTELASISFLTYVGSVISFLVLQNLHQGSGALGRSG